MNVCIVTEGGKNIGFGHITRCTAVHQALQVREIQPTFIINGDESIQQQSKSSGVSCINFDWLNDVERLFSYIENADIVFIDSYLAECDLCEKISSIVKMGVYFDDTIRMNYPKGVVVNGAILAEQMPYPKREEVTYLLGARYAPLRKEFWDATSKPIRDDIEVIMITFGGADMCNLTPKVLKLLVDTYPELTKKVVIGKGFQNRTEIETVKDHNTELICYPDTAEMKKIMLESDVAISAGGQTLYELARIGVPAIVIAVADNQSANIRGWQEVGFIEYAGIWDSSSIFRNIGRILQKMENHTLRKERIQKGISLIDGKGCLRVVDFLLDKFENKWYVDNCG